MNIENRIASGLNGGGSTLRISGLTATDGHVLTVQADGTLATEAAAASGVGGSTGESPSTRASIKAGSRVATRNCICDHGSWVQQDS